MKVFYSPKMVADSQSFSPSAAKPAQVADWLHEAGASFEMPRPATRKMLYRAHKRHYVDDVLSGKAPNGFGNTSVDVAKSLPYTTGAMVAATLHALTSGETCAALCSGFHHATYSSGGGFCTFNGLIVAAREALSAGATKIGILDLDEHYGNGTDDIINKLSLQKQIAHYSGGAHFSNNPADAEPFLKALPHIMQKHFRKCDVIIYQAGADVHINDPLGGWMTTEQMRRRDKIVFQVARAMGIPVAWNLAGGYQKDAAGTIDPVLQIHLNTYRACLEVQAKRKTA